MKETSALFADDITTVGEKGNLHEGVRAVKRESEFRETIGRKRRCRSLLRRRDMRLSC